MYTDLTVSDVIGTVKIFTTWIDRPKVITRSVLVRIRSATIRMDVI